VSSAIGGRAMTEAGPGRLVVVGTGIRTVGQMTTEALSWIRAADKVLYVVGDPIAEAMLHDLNPAAESLSPFYAVGKERIITYNENDRLHPGVRPQRPGDLPGVLRASRRLRVPVP